MGRNGKDALELFERELEELLHEHHHPAERRIRYGNLRCEISDAGDKLTNAAVVYETPGGSTTQINVICDEDAGSFSYLSRDLETTEISEDPLEVVAMIRHHANAIPDKRLTALFNQIDVWLAEGKTRSEMFGEMNKLLQTEFLGGRIANEELKAGIQHIVTKYSRHAS